MVRVTVTHDSQAPFEVALGDAPLLIGRAPTNDVVIPDDQLSWLHAVVWVEGGRVHIRDLGSKNGCSLGGERLRDAAILQWGDRVLLGTHTALAIDGSAAVAPRSLLVLDLDSGVQVPIRTERFQIGSEPASDLRVEGPPRAATLVIDAEGDVLLATDDSAVVIRPGQEFEVTGRRLRLVEADPTRAPTVQPAPDLYGYRLRVNLDGPAGAEASFENPATGATHLVEAENRATLLYLLARQVVGDLREAKPDAEIGWVGDDDLGVGVWGRGGATDANHLHVLVYRLRRELTRAGFDPWFIEKRRRALRIRLRDVQALPDR